MFNLEGRAMRTRDVGGSAWRGSESSWGSACLLRMVYVEVATVGLVDNKRRNSLSDRPHKYIKFYRAQLYSAQSTFKKDPGRARQNSLATAGTNFTKPGAQNKGDLCMC